MSQQERADKAAINNLEMLGSDTERDHPFEFFLYFPDEWNAYAAAAHLFNLQFRVSVSFSEITDDWLCLATKDIKPTTGRILGLSRFLEKLADDNKGEYDGWGTPVLNDAYLE